MPRHTGTSAESDAPKGVSDLLATEPLGAAGCMFAGEDFIWVG